MRTLLAIIIAILLGIGGLYTYNTFHKTNTPEYTSSFDNDTSFYIEKRSIEQAMADFKDEVEWDRCYKIYLSLPPIIVQSIYEQIGTNKSVCEIVKEYEMNSNYYISKQIQDQLQQSGLKKKGPDGDRIEKVEISTVLKPKTPVDSSTVLNVEVKDTIK